MIEVGIILHKAASGRLILKANSSLMVGEVLYDINKQGIARVVEIFGPVSSPYASAMILLNEKTILKDEKLFTLHKRG